jgi:hypothetical protein
MGFQSWRQNVGFWGSPSQLGMHILLKIQTLKDWVLASTEVWTQTLGGKCRQWGGTWIFITTFLILASENLPWLSWLKKSRCSSAHKIQLKYIRHRLLVKHVYYDFGVIKQTYILVCTSNNTERTQVCTRTQFSRYQKQTVQQAMEEQFVTSLIIFLLGFFLLLVKVAIISRKV